MAAVTEADAAGVQPAARVAKQSDSAQTGLRCAGLAPPEDAEHDMLHLDDEIAGLVEAANVSAAQDGMHITKPEPASSVPGEAPVVHSMFAAAPFAIACAVLCCACGSALHCCNAVTAPVQFAVMYLLTCLCGADHPLALLPHKLLYKFIMDTDAVTARLCCT